MRFLLVEAAQVTVRSSSFFVSAFAKFPACRRREGDTNVIIFSSLYDKNRMTVFYERFVIVSAVQNLDKVAHLKAQRI